MEDYSDRSFGIDDGNRKKSTKRIVIGAILVLAVGIGLGVIIGWFSHTYDEPATPAPSSKCDFDGLVRDEDTTILKTIKEKMKASNIDANLRNFTLNPHLGGTPAEEALADQLHQMWTAQGLDHVTKVTYEVLLSYPNATDPCRIYILDSSDTVIYETQEVEKILSPDQNRSDVVPPFNAYAQAGDVEGELIYVNYGSIEDFTELYENYSMNVTGKIVIARYGKIFRGDKVALAAKHGAIGVILYSDPADYSENANEDVFPNSWWLPGTGVQRGTVMLGDGDPLTPGYPAVETAYETKTPDLPTIPVHPIGYDDAYHFLSRMDGMNVSDSWQGKLNFTYRLGPGFVDKNLRVKLHVTTYRKKVNTSNVFAYIKGSVEPDRYVLLGNHRDAWVFGAVDPTSGTAVMMEVSRVLAEIVKEGRWRPRRSIVFCSWGAEEYGLVASYEWVEQQLKILGDRAIAYLNVDIAVEGMQSLRAAGVPLLYDILYDASKKINSANDDATSLYQEWLNFFPDEELGSTVPVIHKIGGGSDFSAFIRIAGVPCIDLRYTYNYSILDYPLYHSVYETYDLMKDHMDRDFKRSLTIGLLWAELARSLSDKLILPLNAVTYADMVVVFVGDLEKGYGHLMTANGVTLDGIKKATENFQVGAKEFMDRLSTANKSNPVETRMYNDQLIRVERAFINSDGLPLSPLKKHLLFASSTFDSYAGATFPGLVDLMYGIEDLEGDAKIEQWEKVKKHLATIIFCIDSATFGLKPWTSFD